MRFFYIYSYNPETRTCVMSSESFYSSWTGSKQVPGAVSCYRHHAGMRSARCG